MDIKEKFKALPTPKKVIVIGGALVVLLFVFRKLAGAGSSSPASISSEDYSQKLGSIGSSDGGGSGTSTGGGNYASAEEVSYISGQLDALTEALGNTQTQTAEALQTVQDNVTASQNENNFLSALVELPSIYSDTLDDSKQFQNSLTSIQQAVSGGTLTQNQGNTAVSFIAGLGNNGVAQPGGVSVKAGNVLNDAALQASEIARTNAVIANREAAGLDTTNQKTWLGWISGQTPLPETQKAG